jgi:hypothetical protein
MGDRFMCQKAAATRQLISPLGYDPDGRQQPFKKALSGMNE